MTDIAKIKDAATDLDIDVKCLDKNGDTIHIEIDSESVKDLYNFLSLFFVDQSLSDIESIHIRNTDTENSMKIDPDDLERR